MDAITGGSDTEYSRLEHISAVNTHKSTSEQQYSIRCMYSTSNAGYSKGHSQWQLQAVVNSLLLDSLFEANIFS